MNFENEWTFLGEKIILFLDFLDLIKRPVKLVLKGRKNMKIDLDIIIMMFFDYIKVEFTKTYFWNWFHPIIEDIIILNI